MKLNEAMTTYSFPLITQVEIKLSKKFILATLTYIDKFSLILLARSSLQQPYKVHFHFVEPHVDVASLTRSCAGSQVDRVKLVHGCTNVLPPFQIITHFDFFGTSTLLYI